ncbi:MAG: hypothetical protein PHQ32_02355 [Firmicutes bacterium]|nr:hypothetical protein [Bacillota bacterium]
MCTSENFVLYEMKKEGHVKFVSAEQVDAYIREGWKKCKAQDLGGKK